MEERGGVPLEEIARRLRSPLDRLLLVFSDVRPGEGATGLLLQASVFCLLTATYFLKPARDGLLATTGLQGLSDMELKAYSSFGQSLLLLAVVPIYCRVARRLDRDRLVIALTLFFISNLVVFWLLQPGLLFDHVPFLGLIFYLWFGVFNLLAVVQFWSFAADIYDDDDGMRLFPAIAFGATAGSAAGAWMAQALVRSGHLSTYSLLPVAAVALALSVTLQRLAGAREAVTRTDSGTTIDRAPWSDRSALRLVLTNRYLLATALVVLVASWVKTNSDNLLFSVVQEVVQREAATRGISDSAFLDRFMSDQTTAFYGDFFFWVNLFGLGLQAIIASRLLKYAGFGVLLLALPLLSIIGYSALVVFPILALFRVAKIAEDSTNYSLQNTALQVLWLPTTHEMKYKGKAAIDTLFVRVGDGMAALTTFVGVQILLLSVRHFFALNAILVAGWLVAATVVVRSRRALVHRTRKAAR